MTAVVVLGMLIMTRSFAAGDVMASRYGNTTIALDANGTATRLLYAADGTFEAVRSTQHVHGLWKIENGLLCLSYKLPPHGPDETDCFTVAPHAVGDVWIVGNRRAALVQGAVTEDMAEVKAVLAAASRVGNTVVAKDPDGSETRLYWRPDHTFSATRPGWKTEGTWKVSGSSLLLHYNVPRPNMGSDEEMKNAVPRAVGEVWGLADRKVTLVAGEQLQH